MNPRKYRWSKHYESAEEELLEYLTAKNIDAERWVGREREAFGPHVEPHDIKIWCAEGSIVYTIDNKPYSLQPGDTLEIPANNYYEAAAGISGCVCYQSPAAL